MKKKGYSKIILKIAHIFEVFISCIVLLAVLIGSFQLINSVWDTYIMNGSYISYEELQSLLSFVILLVIGIELVIMFSLHVPADTLIEVITFTIAYKIVMMPKSEGMLGVLCGVASLAGVFAIKKYLIKEPKNNEKEDSEVDKDNNLAS